jgi:hypothetical protein
MLRQGLGFAVGFALVSTAFPVRAGPLSSDDSIHLWHGTAFREPFNPNDVAKSVITFTHVDEYKWGGNFLNIDMYYSHASSGDSVHGLNDVSNVGSVEVYLSYRNTLSLNGITGSKAFALGRTVKDLGIVLGTDLNTRNDAHSSRKVMPVAGFGAAFNVPGFLNVDLLLFKEWNVNAIAGRSVAYDVTPMVSVGWGIPVYGPVSFEGFGSVSLPKGNGGDGLADTVTEVHVHPKLMIDVGQFFGSKGYQVGVGYEYWLNKYGSDHTGDRTGGSSIRALFVEGAIHL